MAVEHGYGRIVTDNLSLHFDPKDNRCYPGSGTTIFDLSGNGRNSSLSGAYVDSSKNIKFRGQGDRDGNPTGDYMSLSTTATTTNPSSRGNGVTYNMWLVFDSNQPNGHSLLYGSGTINHLEWRGSVTTGYWRTEAVRQNGYSFGASAVSYGRHEIGKWFNLCIVFANNESGRPVRWYHNGVLFHTGDMTSGNFASSEYFQPSSFGRATGTSAYLYSQSFNGRMGVFSTYMKTLTQKQITQNYNVYKNRFL